MVDWSASMQQTFEYYTVDPNTWMDNKKIENVKSCSISRDSEAETLGSATIDITESLGECYIRVYLVTIQNGITEKHPLGTYLVQSPSASFDGRSTSISMDAYTPLIELKEDMPPLGYYVANDKNIMDIAYRLTREHVRAPVVKSDCDTALYYDFVSDTSDTWTTFLSDLITNANYSFALDELGRILFAPKQDTASLAPVWTYTDDNSSILYPDISLEHDLYGIPNVVEVVYSNGNEHFYSKAINDDINSPISTVNRGREIIYRVTNPDLASNPKLEIFYYKVNYNKDTGVYTRERIKPINEPKGTTTIISGAITETGEQVFYKWDTDGTGDEYYFCGVEESRQIKEYTEQVLREMSTLEYTISYVHGYCPVRLGDCVMLNYEKAGLKNVKAKVISQNIKCEPGCPVTEKAVFTARLWR